MKKIIDEARGLSSQDIAKLRALLKAKKSKNNSELVSALLSYRGLDILLSHLNTDELKILRAASSVKGGATLSEIEKMEGISTDRAEELSKDLSGKLLIYVLKNRQKIHNRFDKLYILPEIGDLLNPIENNTITSYFLNVKNILENDSEDRGQSVHTDFNIQANMETVNKLFTYILTKGGIVSLGEAKKLVPDSHLEDILGELKRKKLIYIYHSLNSTFKTYLLLSEKIYASLIRGTGTFENSPGDLHVNNQYMLLINILNVFDAVSTYGLFLTKQKEYRKVDRMRITDSMYKVFNYDGKEIDPHDISGLCLFILEMQKSLKLENDSVMVSFKNKAEELKNPEKHLLSIIKLLNDDTGGNPLFRAPFDIPSYEDVLSIINIIYKSGETSITYLESYFLLKSISELDNSDLTDLKSLREKIGSRFKTCLKYLSISGIIEVQDDVILLTQPGNRITKRFIKTREKKRQHRSQAVPNSPRSLRGPPGMASPRSGTVQNSIHVEKNKPGDSVQKDQKNPDSDKGKIYINPDFKLIIPKREVPPEALYHILSHTEIVKDDVIIYASISRNSILKAYKRGMLKDKFLSNLKEYSKNDIPQNLEFMINEWSEQAIHLAIKNATILKSSHPSFIDELSYSDLKAGILERISPNYAIIDRKFLDKFVRHAKKSEALIQLFDDE